LFINEYYAAWRTGTFQNLATNWLAVAWTASKLKKFSLPCCLYECKLYVPTLNAGDRLMANAAAETETPGT